MIVGLAALFMPFAAANASGPSLALSPASGAPGSSVQLVGTTFPARIRLQVAWDGVTAGMPTAQVNGNGSFKTTIVVPEALSEAHTISVAQVGVAKGARSAAQVVGAFADVTFTVTEFDVTPPPTIPGISFDPEVTSDPGATTTPGDTPAPTDTPPAGSTPDPTATLDPTATPDPTATVDPTATPAPTPRPTPAPTPRPTPAPTPNPTPTPPPVNSSLSTGMAAHFMWESLADANVDLNRMAAAHMDLARFDFSWANSEATKGTYLYFSKLDAVLDAIHARGMKAVITVIETPSWANGGAGKFAPPSNPADYAHFMGLLAQHTAARSGMVWEIWNEPNDPHFWTTGPNAAQYSAMLKDSYAAIKANDANATVLGGSILSNDLGFLRGMYTAGAGNSFDGLSIHPYTAGRAPSDTSSAWFSFATSVPQFKSVMAAHGQYKPIWITEVGWSTGQVSDATRAVYMKTAVAIARGWTNVRGFAAYTIRQTQFLQYGMITSSGVETLTWKAYASVQ